MADDTGEDWSGRPDSNGRPPAPKAGALPGCATPRARLPRNPRIPLPSVLDYARGEPSPRLARSVKRLASLILVNLAVRGAWVAGVHPAPQSDFGFYFSAAARLAAGGGYTIHGQPTAYWPMGWPAVLSIFFRILGPHLWVGLLVQVLACTGIAVMAFLIARYVTGSATVGLLAGLAWTLLPDQLAWTAILGSEPVFTLLVLGGLYAFLRLDGWRRPVIAGALLGAACWVRPTVILFPVALVIVLALYQRRLLAPLAQGALLAAAMLAVISPLTIRNAAVLGSPVLVSTNGGVNLWQGVHTDDRYWWSSDPALNPLAPIGDEVARDRLGQRLFIEHLIDHPASVAYHGLRKIATLYSPPADVWWWLTAGHPGSVAALGAVTGVAYWLFVSLAVIGLVLGWRRFRWPTLLLGSFLVYYTAVFAFFPTGDRFRYPLMPVLAVFAGLAIFEVAGAVRRRWIERLTPP
jgi:4-amino-4-deoxy-L-arabinose transferase-like glycosyltransferase